MSTRDRVSNAKALTEKLSHRASALVELHENNRLLAYSDRVSAKIPHSREANAFIAVRDTLVQAEVMRLVGLWEKPDDNTISIPTIATLLNSPEVVETIQDEWFRQYDEQPIRFLNSHRDVEIQRELEELSRRSQTNFAADEATRCAEGIHSCLETIFEWRQDGKIEEIKNIRDHFTHHLTQTRREEKSEIEPVRIREVHALYFETIRLSQDLYLWVNGASYDLLGEETARYRRNAEGLWLASDFSELVKRRD